MAPVLSPPPDDLAPPCDAPQTLPDRALTQSEVEVLWARDQAALISCGQSLEALREFYRKRDARLSQT